MRRSNKILTAVTVIVAVAAFICAIYIAYRQMGIVEGYDFGAGAYYYADIPGFETLIDEEVYSTQIPIWIHVILFLGWGWLMWRLWCWIDNRR